MHPTHIPHSHPGVLPPPLHSTATPSAMMPLVGPNYLMLRGRGLDLNLGDDALYNAYAKVCY